jgi:hypothetical protein
MGDDRSIGDRRKQFVETHAATVTGGDEDGCQHDRKKKRPTPNAQRSISNSEISCSALDVRR